MNSMPILLLDSKILGLCGANVADLCLPVGRRLGLEPQIPEIKCTYIDTKGEVPAETTSTDPQIYTGFIHTFLYTDR